MLYPGRGDGRNGALSLVANTTASHVNVAITLAVGTASATITTGLTIAAGDLFFVHQTQGTNHGRYDFLFVSSYNSGTGAIVFTSNALYDYSSAASNKAQAVLVPQYTTMATNGFTLSAPAWGGSVGGIYVAVALATPSGTYSASGKGFRGGTGINGGTNLYAQYGEGYSRVAGTPASPGDVADNGGGGAFKANPGHRFGGGGGGNLVGGGTGNGSGDGQVGSAGLTASSSDGTLMDFGGGGGGGAGDSGASDGGIGGGICWIIAANFGTITITVAGIIGGGAANVGGGGGGAAGCGRAQGDSVDCATYTSTQTGGNGGSSGGSTGGFGGSSLGIGDFCSVSNAGSSTFVTLNTGGQTWCSVLGSII